MIWYIVFDCVLWDAHTIHDVFTSFSDTSSLTDWSSRRCLDFLISSSWLMCRDVYNTYWMCGFLSSLSTCFCGTFHHNSIQSNTSCLKCVHNSYLGIFVCVCLYVSFYHTNPYVCVPVIPVTVRCYENAQPPSCSYQAKIIRGELSLVFKNYGH